MSFDQDPGEQANISGADLAIMCDEIVTLKQQRDDLLEALEKIAEVCNGYDLEAGWACKHARAAITKVTQS